MNMFEREIYSPKFTISGQPICQKGHDLDWHWSSCPFCREEAEKEIHKEAA